MKGCLSLLLALLVVLLLAAGGYWAYQNYSGVGSPSGHVLTVPGGDVSLALTNGTNFVLTVVMREGPALVRFEIAPGHSETKSFESGVYSVDGKISDPSTDRFSSQWTFQDGGRYKATFSRDGQAITTLVLAEAQPGTNTTNSPPPTGKKKLP
jgi:hypothetical protein